MSLLLLFSSSPPPSDPDTTPAPVSYELSSRTFRLLDARADEIDLDNRRAYLP